MRKSPIFLTVILLLAATLVSCGGNDDLPAEKELVISVDKAGITGDGTDEARFTVMYGWLDVTSASQICMADETCLDQPLFTSDQLGEYEFYATYKDGDESVRSVNTVKVAVTDGFDPSKVLHKNVGLFIWTSTDCFPCHTLKTALKTVMQNEKYKGRIEYVNFYTSDRSMLPSVDEVACPLTETFADQMTSVARFSIDGYPSTIFDMARKVEGGIPVSDLKKFIDDYVDAPARTGIKVNSSIENGKINVIVNVGVREAGAYYLGVLLTEDDVKAHQNGGGDNYAHTNVVRDAGMENIFGDELGEISAGDVVTKNYSFDISSAYKTQNLHIAVYTLYRNSEGVKIMANTVKAAANGFTDYSYAE